jgi:hypothetical protein
MNSRVGVWFLIAVFVLIGFKWPLLWLFGMFVAFYLGRFYDAHRWESELVKREAAAYQHGIMTEKYERKRRERESIP